MSGWDGDLEILPDTTSDERGDGRSEDDSNEDRLLSERPPHWG